MNEELDKKQIEELATETIKARTNVVEQGSAADDAIKALTVESLNEPIRATKAFKDYVGLGKGRTLEMLARDYSKVDNLDWTDNFESVYRQLKTYSSKYKWQERLRMLVVKASAEVLAGAQREAFVNTKERVRVAHNAYEAGIKIIEKAELDKLTVEEARRLLKPGGTLIQLGLINERAEQGDMLAVLRPDKPVSEMSDEELDEFATTLQKAIQ